MPAALSATDADPSPFQELLGADIKWLIDLLNALFYMRASGAGLQGTTWERLPQEKLAAARTHILLFRNQSACPFPRFLFRHLRRICRALADHAQSASCFGKVEPLPGDVRAFVDTVEGRHYQRMLHVALRAAADVGGGAVVMLPSLRKALDDVSVTNPFYLEAHRQLERLRRDSEQGEALKRVAARLVPLVTVDPDELRLPLASAHAELECLAPVERLVDQALLHALRFVTERLRALHERATGSAATVLLPQLVAHEDGAQRALLEDLVPPAACIAHLASLQQAFFRLSIRIIERERRATAAVDYTELVPSELDADQTLSSREERAHIPGPPKRPGVQISEEERRAAPRDFVASADLPDPLGPHVAQPAEPRDYEAIVRHSVAPAAVLLVAPFASIVWVVLVATLVALFAYRQHVRTLLRRHNAHTSPTLPVTPLVEPATQSELRTSVPALAELPQVSSRPIWESELFRSQRPPSLSPPADSDAPFIHALTEAATRYGLEVSPDLSRSGDCLFAAAAQQLRLLQALELSAKDLRDAVVLWLRTNGSFKLVRHTSSRICI